jgi:hypothetical protein
MFPTLTLHGKRQHVVVRNDDLSFWDTCITELEVGGMKHRRRMTVLNRKVYLGILFDQTPSMEEENISVLILFRTTCAALYSISPPADGNAVVEIDVLDESESPGQIAALQTKRHFT